MKCVAVVLCAVALSGVRIAKDDTPVADLVKKHSDSIGSEQARSSRSKHESQKEICPFSTA